ncbi:glycerophosphodiester phosphodiesterase family protein [Teichococcus vastitatis]|uniref:glycerophosphodiester phosphodiesterase n=1 Tax=Teichococcus vastitatis TaxID=2307076 RepID=A0ABS9WAP0_9PROT|nr:glycerophosphodiester phosphodiesterase family protein [Pseudoroseomonas vastitatis]MCI0756367.1 endonuclease/exonuclease/phosphatase family protein [Pseudoroseomonas vastitatis]
MVGNNVSNLRVATFNASLNRAAEGELLSDLATGADPQARTVAEIIQRSAPDILLINEFDYVADDAALNRFRDNYLAAGQNTLGLQDGGGLPVDYPYGFTAPSNTGLASGFDLNNDGAAVSIPGTPGYGDDALGFGNYPGQYGMAIYSKYPILQDQVRTFQNFLWKDMPDARLPDDASTPKPGDFYSADELAVLPLSSKTHWDIPVLVDGKVVHIIVAHPTPPTFDGNEDRNGLRNADEIRLLRDYVTPGAGDYIYDDQGLRGGLEEGARFVIMGDMNADPRDGDSVDLAINQLLGSAAIEADLVPESEGAAEAAELQGGANDGHDGDPAQDTADFADNAPGNLRADYVLPSAAGLAPVESQVFWPTAADPLFPLAGNYDPALPPTGFPASDHRLVSMDLSLEPGRFNTLDGTAPEVVAHRGASASRPEHTLEAYRVAIEQGADLIEPDLVLTKDGHLIDRHEPMLSGTTDIADHPEFAARRTTKILEGETVTDWFAEDFTLAEIKTLWARERIPEIRPDSAEFDNQFRIPTLVEVIDLVKQVEDETGRQVGIIPELKHPTYFEYEGRHQDGSRIGVDTSRLLIETLTEQDFTDPSRVLVQSFEIANLIELQTEIMPEAGIDLPLVQLTYDAYQPDVAFHLDPDNLPKGADPSLYALLDFPLRSDSAPNGGESDLYSAEALRAMAELYADVLSPWDRDVLPSKPLEVPVDGDGDGQAEITRILTGEVVDLAARAHAAGMEFVPYTLRTEEAFQSLNADGTTRRPVEEFLTFFSLGADKVFTDSPDVGRQIVDQLAAGDGAIAAANATGGNDIWVYEAAALTSAKASSGVDTALFAGSGRIVLPDGIENIELRGENDVTIIGNDRGNHVTGNAGNNIVVAGAGADHVFGGDGYDAVLFSDRMDAYCILVKDGEATVTEKATGMTDRLNGVESLLFLDGQRQIGCGGGDWIGS